MKGVHIALEALEIIKNDAVQGDLTLNILGEGPEKSNLVDDVKHKGLIGTVKFKGTFSYPEEFFNEIAKDSIMLLTNLSDEQPRLIFDAISQGLLPICPNTNPYRALNLAPQTLYDVGKPDSLAKSIIKLSDPVEFEIAMEHSRKMANQFTIEAMHRNRAKWISSLLDNHV